MVFSSSLGQLIITIIRFVLIINKDNSIIHRGGGWAAIPEDTNCSILTLRAPVNLQKKIILEKERLIKIM